MTHNELIGWVDEELRAVRDVESIPRYRGDDELQYKIEALTQIMEVLRK